MEQDPHYKFICHYWSLGYWPHPFHIIKFWMILCLVSKSWWKIFCSLSLLVCQIYEFWLSLLSMASLSTKDQVSSRLYKWIWNVKLPPRIAIWAWQTINNMIPKLNNRTLKKITQKAKCSLYSHTIKSREHALYYFPKARGF